MCMMSLLSSYIASYTTRLWALYLNFKQNIEHNRLESKELPERKIGEKNSKIGSSLLLHGTVLDALKVSDSE